MNVIFLEVINNSITASYLIVAVIILRLLLKKIPKWSVCLLWAMVALRLMMPFEIESRFSLLPKAGLMRAEEQKNGRWYLTPRCAAITEFAKFPGVCHN